MCGEHIVEKIISKNAGVPVHICIRIFFQEDFAKVSPNPQYHCPYAWDGGGGKCKKSGFHLDASSDNCECGIMSLLKSCDNLQFMQ